MAIGNVTPDSFYGESRLMSKESGMDSMAVVKWAEKALSEGADILDIGGCSTRPGSTPASEEEEWRRVEPALRAIRHSFPETHLSLDTFRPAIAQRALDLFGSMIINDISGGDETMYSLAERYKVPYIFTFRGDYSKLRILAERDTSRWILDPGLGFCGGVENDYACLRNIDTLGAYGRPVLVGVSRKSMIYKPLGLTPESCLTPTQALQLYAIEHGATIIRTHDVRDTKNIVTLWNNINRKS